MSIMKQNQFVIRVGLTSKSATSRFYCGALIIALCGLHGGFRIVDCVFAVFLIHFRPTLYIGEHAGGLYALPSLVEEGSPLVEVRSLSIVLKGLSHR